MLKVRGEQHSGWNENDLIEEALLCYDSRKEKEANANGFAAYGTVYKAGAGGGG